MSLIPRISIKSVLQTVFVITAIILVEAYLRKTQNDHSQLQTSPTTESSQTKSSQSLQIKVVRAEICLDVDEGRPLGCKDSFNRNIDRLYCFTQISGLRRGGYIIHRWYHKNKLRNEVILELSSNRNAVWSSAEMSSKWTGQWRVKVLAQDETLLFTKPFELY